VIGILKEPIFHFFLGGSLFFVLFAWNHPRESEARPDKIHVSQDQIDVLIGSWVSTWQRPPTDQELEYLIENHVREEIYCREARKLGLDENDAIIRRRLRQKMEFLSEDFEQPSDPGDDELQRFLLAHANEFQEPTVLSFRQVYFSPDVRGDSTEKDASDALKKIQEGTPDQELDRLGDKFFLERKYLAQSVHDVARVFGDDFVPKLLNIEERRWSGPLRSGFGYHLVLLIKRVHGRLPELWEIRDAVLQRWQVAERKSRAESFYRRLRANYQVDVEGLEARVE
jgi:hypothetical protein